MISNLVYKTSVYLYQMHTFTVTCDEKTTTWLYKTLLQIGKQVIVHIKNL